MGIFTGYLHTCIRRFHRPRGGHHWQLAWVYVWCDTGGPAGYQSVPACMVDRVLPVNNLRTGTCVHRSCCCLQMSAQGGVHRGSALFHAAQFQDPSMRFAGGYNQSHLIEWHVPVGPGHACETHLELALHKLGVTLVKPPRANHKLVGHAPQLAVPFGTNPFGANTTTNK